jgi:activator of HSP90 ATPase
MVAKTRTIRQSEFFPGVEPAEIYAALLSGPKHTRMTGGKATGSTKVGGRFTAWDGYITGRNVELEEGRRIAQEWHTTQWPEGAPPSLLEWTFEAKKGGTKVTMKHSKVPSSQADSYEKGWQDYYFIPMKQYFAR